MDLAAFKQSLAAAAPPAGLAPALLGLWWDAKGDWNKAHEYAQLHEDPPGCRVHAYLHRKEGDRGNAGYWYGRVGLALPETPLQREWEEIAQALLAAD